MRIQPPTEWMQKAATLKGTHHILIMDAEADSTEFWNKDDSEPTFLRPVGPTRSLQLLQRPERAATMGFRPAWGVTENTQWLSLKPPKQKESK